MAVLDSERIIAALRGAFAREESREALLRLTAEKIRAARPERFAVYLTSRGITNEVYYAAQKAARFFGSPHVFCRGPR